MQSEAYLLFTYPDEHSSPTLEIFMRTYICFYGGRQIELNAETLLGARDAAAAAFRVRNSQRYMVHVYLADVAIDTATLGA